MKEIISDVHCEYHGETNLIHFVVEFPDGTEKCIRQVMPDYVPDWAEQYGEAEDYEEWYNTALEEAHFQGYVLEGEE